MDNPLLAPSPLDISPGDEVAMKQELVEAGSVSLAQLRRHEVEARRQLLQLDSRELNLDAVEQLNANINALVALASSPETAARVAQGVKSGKDFAEFAKGVTALAELRDNLLDKAIDDSGSGGKKKRILAQFQGQGVKMVVGVETDG